MPCFERVFRSLALHLAKDEHAKRELQAYYRGLDRARWEVVLVALVVSVLFLIAWVASS